MAKVSPAAKKPAAPKNSAAPGTADTKAEKVKKVAYPGLFDKDGADQKLTAIPTDWDQKVHEAIKRKDFADESMWFDMQADKCDARAKFYRDQAEEQRKLGNSKDRAKAKKLINMQKRFDELKAQLSEQGVDVESLLTSEEG